MHFWYKVLDVFVEKAMGFSVVHPQIKKKKKVLLPKMLKNRPKNSVQFSHKVSCFESKAATYKRAFHHWRLHRKDMQK